MAFSDKIISYLRSTKEEVRKVSWPTRKETFRYSALVVCASVLIAVFFATLDFGFTKLVDVVVQQRAASVTAPQPQTPPQVDVTPTTASGSAPATSVPTLDLKDIQTAPVEVKK